MNKTRKFLVALVEKSIVYSMTNKIVLDELEKIDSRVSSQIRRNFLPITPPHLSRMRSTPGVLRTCPKGTA